MRILNRSVFVGPNRFALFPVIYLEVDLGPLEAWPSARLGPAFIDPLCAGLPGLAEHGCSYREPEGFIRRLREGEGTWMGHILEHVAIELQNVAGTPVNFGKTRSLALPGQYYVVYQYVEPEVGFEAGNLALTFLHSLIPEELRAGGSVPPDFDFGMAREAFIRRAQRLSLGPSTLALVKSAEQRQIPWQRINDSSLLQLGHGRYQRRIEATVTGNTSHIAAELAADKVATNQLLRTLGIPVPGQWLVGTETEAMEAAARLGPVVIKPRNGNHGRGVSVGLETPEAVRDAFRLASALGPGVLVEQCIPGEDYRLLVVNGRLVAAAHRVPGHVVGDGSHTIQQLVALVNADPRRGVGHEKVLTRILFDPQAEEMLARQGFTRKSVPPAGQRVPLRATANLSTGGTARDVTDIVHPDNVAMAIRAAQAVGLDVAGVDFVTTDIARSYRDTGGAICEVNAGPGFRMHVAPSEGEPRDVAGAVMDLLFPAGAPCRIPIAGVTGTNGKTTVARMLAHIAKLAGRHVGLTSTDGVYIDGRLTVEGDMTGPVATRMVLSDPAVDFAVLELARGGLVRAGMGVPFCDVGAVLNVEADHLGLGGIETLEALADVKGIVVEVARDAAVLNADDPLCAAMAARTRASMVCYVSLQPSNELVRQHILSGGRAVVLEQGMNGAMLTLYDHGAKVPVLLDSAVPATFAGRARHNVQNAMFALAMAHSLGISLDDIRNGLQTFDTTFFQAPGRGNLFTDLPFRVLLDYAHNAAAMRAVAGLVEELDAPGRWIVVLTCPGDRRDEDIRAIARAAAGRFDLYIAKEDDDPRGRPRGQVATLLRDTLLAEGTPPEEIAVVLEEPAAVDTALREGRPGDLVLILADQTSRCWEQITSFAASAPRVERRHASGFGPALWRGLERRGYIRQGNGVLLKTEGENGD